VSNFITAPRSLVKNVLSLWGFLRSNVVFDLKYPMALRKIPYTCYDAVEKCHHDLFVEGITRRDIKRCGNFGAGCSGLPNGRFRWLGASRRPAPARDKMGFRSASRVREGGVFNTSVRFFEATTWLFPFSSSSSVMDDAE
jgi:hypothetical protein